MTLPIGWGFLGTNINPGNIHFEVQMDIDSSKQLTHDRMKVAFMFSLKASNAQEEAV
jgi:hypothetical protein